MAGSGGPWGGGPGKDDDDRPRGEGGRQDGGRDGGKGGQLPDIDQMVRKGTEQLRVLMGGKARPGGFGGGNGGNGGWLGRPRNLIGVGVLALVALWAYESFYTVRPEEKSVELFLGRFSRIGDEGLHFAPWPLVRAEVFPVSLERTEDIGVGQSGGDAGLMLTGDENIVDIDFQVVWNVSDPEKYLFNLRDPQLTIQSVAESAMREIIAQTALAPILNRDRGMIAQSVQQRTQAVLDSYNSGLNVVRVNFLRADPPREVIDAFKEVQSAEQERDRLQKEADAYSNKVLAGARGEAAQVLEQAQAYRAQVVNQAEGEASRFTSVLGEYQKAPDVTRKRLYLETMEDVMGRLNKVIVDDRAGAQGVVPYLPLDGLTKKPAPASSGAGGTTGGGAAVGTAPAGGGN
ncbi:MAG: FtsH protease activity modulator HflK [Proteobacteria bacterium]|nr:FtsH protease activity modulator HflK [Pseudomonadota bacterium]MBS0573420.1 FtsH protease activity modulator HflK [Pseudomonadota bacterium]